MKKRRGIYKRGNIYWVIYRSDGRQRFHSTHSSDIHDAESLLENKKKERSKGCKPKRRSEAPTVDEPLDSYIAQVENSATQKSYRLSQKVLSAHCGKTRITEVDAFIFDRFKESRINEGVTPAGINRDMY